MKRYSIEEAFSWAQGFIAREWRLLVPVALALFALPPLMMDLLVPQAMWDAFNRAAQTQNPQLAAAATPVVLPVMAVVLVIAAAGGLAVTALALLPAISVREALSLALRRLPVMIGALLLVVLGEMIVTLVLSIVVAVAHLNAPGAQGILLGMVLGVSMFVTMRLTPLAPMIVTRHVGVTSAIRESWHITQGAFWRIFATVLIYGIGAVVVMAALTYAVGVILTLSATAFGIADLGRALLAVFQRVVGAALAVGLHVLVAAMFRQLNDAPIRGI